MIDQTQEGAKPGWCNVQLKKYHTNTIFKTLMLAYKLLQTMAPIVVLNLRTPLILKICVCPHLNLYILWRRLYSLKTHKGKKPTEGLSLEKLLNKQHRSKVLHNCKPPKDSQTLVKRINSNLSP